jgi:hypothetical protein
MLQGRRKKDREVPYLYQSWEVGLGFSTFHAAITTTFKLKRGLYQAGH